MKICPECGNAAGSDDDTMCLFCGRMFVVAKKAPQKTEPDKTQENAVDASDTDLPMLPVPNMEKSSGTKEGKIQMRWPEEEMPVSNERKSKNSTGKNRLTVFIIVFVIVFVLIMIGAAQ
ncbi:MAG: hypothetical protein IJ600_12925 [Lachnospiraceae bacterium]|nr:hypothetical protein [Lachnospiraceae bacterium]